MVVKINWFQKIQWLLIFAVFCASCQPELSENEKFARFAQQYEKMVVRVFPETNTDSAPDSLVFSDLNKEEILRKVEFCTENLDKLSSFDLENISSENTEKLKTIFAEVKFHLREMEKAAEKVSD